MLVLGDKELEEQQVAVRERKQGDIGAMSLAEFKEKITEQTLPRVALRSQLTEGGLYRKKIWWK